MPAGNANKPFRIGTWLVKPDLNRLLDGDRVVALEPRVMGMLVCLASRPGKILSANELLNAVWQGRAHAGSTIYQAATQLRKALGDDIHNPRYIETIPKKGYRLICPVTAVAEDTEAARIAIQSSSGWQNSRRVIAVFSGIASLAAVIILAANPGFRDQLSQTNEGPREKSVAVLPFVDMSQDGNQQYLGDGISEELIHALSNLPDLRVTARTSSFAFRDSNKDIRQIGNQLNVATILEGSVRKDGDRIRITAQLVSSRDGYHLWSKTFDRRTTDLFSIQNEIAIAVARTFEYRQLAALATDDDAARPDDLQTYNHYLLGWHQLRKDSRSSAMLAVQHFEHAIEMNPSFARAYAGLSESYAKRYSFDRDQLLLDKAESAAEYALHLDDQSAMAFSALGHVKSLTRDYSGAEMAYRRALSLNPNDAHAYMYLAFHIAKQDREEEALVMLTKALERHPMSGRLNNWMGNYHNTKPHRDWDVAFKYYKRAMDRDPDFRAPYRSVGLNYRSTGQLDQAIPYFRKIVDLTAGPTRASQYIELLASTYVDIGDYKSAAQVIRQSRELEPRHGGATNSDIHLQLARGNFSAARNLVHGLLPTYIENDTAMGLMAFYEMVIGDTDHAQEIYTRLAVAQEPDTQGQANLYGSNELRWGMMGAVNLAHLHKRNGQNRAAQELLGKARDHIDSKSDDPLLIPGILYVHAQIAAVEGNSDAAIEYVREAVEAGWTKPWFGRIDPIMAELHKDTRFMKILGDLENKLSEMREHPRMLASN